MFAREGYPIIGAALLLSAVLAALGLWTGPVVGIVCLLAAVSVGGFTLFFFRDPDRIPPAGADGLLLAPADGRVVEVVQEEEPIYLKGPATRVSIFLSPLNVHVNRTPASGQIEHERYQPGDYLVAWHPKASTKNERSELGLRHDASGTKVLFKQIAGAVARRIVYHLRVGDHVKAGDRFGLVRFGSRMDVLVPPSVEMQVEEGQHVRGGESILARLPTSAGETTSPVSAAQAGASAEASGEASRKAEALADDGSRSPTP